VFLVLWFLACPAVRAPHGAALDPSAPVPVDAAPELAAAMVRVDALLAGVEGVDPRDRLVELRDLVVLAQSADPALRARLAGYVSRTLAIEERASPAVFAENPMEMADGMQIATEEAVGAPEWTVEPAPASSPDPSVPVEVPAASSPDPSVPEVPAASSPDPGVPAELPAAPLP
jgi:hypothetical protein